MFSVASLSCAEPDEGEEQGGFFFFSFQWLQNGNLMQLVYELMQKILLWDKGS